MKKKQGKHASSEQTVHLLYLEYCGFDDVQPHLYEFMNILERLGLEAVTVQEHLVHIVPSHRIEAVRSVVHHILKDMDFPIVARFVETVDQELKAA
ncbi:MULTISPECIES: hypothetical protein [Paenibacillus]|uniref:hypothetical protein n=1 Tax=Paenibacillus TaxID=44249 RepID=UPI00203ECF09|nr:hypothetical protein [Paenibacillus lactis]MCM3495970.1 hypothetical protein [Paenibacillus lactis]